MEDSSTQNYYTEPSPGGPGVFQRKPSRLYKQDTDDARDGNDDGVQEQACSQSPPAATQPAQKTEPTQAETLMELTKGMLFFRSLDDGKDYANFYNEGHRKTLPISKDFRSYLSAQFCDAKGKPPSSQALQDTMCVIEGKAMQNPKAWLVHVRVASGENALWLDLGDEDWKVVEVTPARWKVIPESPMYFRRPKGMKALPEPVRSGSIEELRKFVNVESEDDFILLVHWLIAGFDGNGPYPILLLQGEQGSAKSTVARVLRELIDPVASALRGLPTGERDLLIAAKNGWVMSFDNLSKLPDSLADAFCRLATGGGLAPRKLWEDDEQMLLDAKRPVILNGIETLTVRGDLADRAIVINLPAIEEPERIKEKEFWRAFYEAQPRILGALLDAVQCVLYNTERKAVGPTRGYMRMADFHHNALMATPVLPWSAERFEEVYRENRKSAQEIILEGDLVSITIEALMEEQNAWKGTATELLKALSEIAEANGKTLPFKAANTLSGHLKRITPALRVAGLKVSDGKTMKGRYIEITRVEERKDDA